MQLRRTPAINTDRWTRSVWSVVAALALSFPVQAWGLEAGATFASRYIWRGFDLNHGDPVVQPWIYYEPPYLKGLSFEIYASLGLGKDENAGDVSNDIDELDLELIYERTLGWDRLKGALGFFCFNNLSNFAQGGVDNRVDFDVKATLSYDVGAGIWVFTSYARGLDGGIRGNYLEMGMSREFTAREDTWAFAPSLSSGLLMSQYGVDNKFAHLTLSLPLTWNLNSFSVSPQLFYHLIPHNEDFDSDSPNVFVGLLELGYSF